MAKHVLEQGSKEWHEFREGKIGASDVSAVLGISPYCTPYQLWRRMLKIDPPIKETESMRFGKQKEEEIRNTLMIETGLIFVPVVFSDDENSFMIASLDGITFEGDIIAEIKTANRFDHETALQGKVPDKYVPQVQQQLRISKAKVCYYTSFHKEEIKIVKVFPDIDYQKDILEACHKFNEYIITKTPPPLSERDYLHRDDDPWKQAVDQYRNLIQLQNNVTEFIDEARNTIIELSKNINTRGCGLELQKVKRQGNIDYATIPELKAINLEDYRKPTSTYWKLTLE